MFDIEFLSITVRGILSETKRLCYLIVILNYHQLKIRFAAQTFVSPRLYLITFTIFFFFLCVNNAITIVSVKYIWYIFAAIVKIFWTYFPCALNDV